MAKCAGGQLRADVGWQAVQEQQQEHCLRVVTLRQEGQQLIHEGGGAQARDKQEGQKLSCELPAGWYICLQQAVFYQLIRIGCVIGETVHDVTDVIEDVCGHLGEDVVPLLLRRHNMRPAKDGIRLLHHYLGCLLSKGSSLKGTWGPD